MNPYIYIVLIAITSLLLSPIIISLLRKLGFYKTKTLVTKGEPNPQYYNHLLKNMDTPSSYGILLIINLILAIYIFNFTDELLYFTLGAIGLGILGLSDDIYQFHFYTKAERWGFKARYKMAIQFIIFLLITNYTFDSIIVSVAFASLSTFILNSFNITDGLDGLAGGIALPTFSVLGYIEYSIYGLTNTLLLIATVFAFLCVFLVFNVKPAKVFLGDSGSYALGVLIAYLTFRYSLWYTAPLIILFLIEGMSSLIQIISMKVAGRRFFKIAPLHLHLLNSGWSQWQVIRTFWITQVVICILTLTVFYYVK